MKPHQLKYPEAGTIFGRLSFIKVAGRWNKTTYWNLKCACGKEKVIARQSVVRGTVLSCGCLKAEMAISHMRKVGKSNATHGLSRTPTWVSWSMMMMRCFNPKRRQYKDWGGRGIKPCAFIALSPSSVIKTIGERPSKEMQLDRPDNMAGYWCGTCEECLANKWPLNIQWSDRTTQNRNKRSTVKIMFQGELKSRPEIVEATGMTYGSVRHHYG